MMRAAGDAMLRSFPTLHADQPDRELLLKNLVDLEHLFDKAAPHLTNGPEASAMTYEMLRQRLHEATSLGDSLNTGFLRNTMFQAFNRCASCHTQDQRMERASGISRLHDLTEYQAAEFSFLTRDYASSMTSFDRYFAGAERSDGKDGNALDRTLVMTAEVYADPGLGAKKLKHYLTKLPKESPLAQRTQSWIDVLDRVKSDETSLLSPSQKTTVSKLDAYLDNQWPAINSMLSWSEQEVYSVVIRGQLNRLLQRTTDKNDAPKLLYWLAVSDRATHYRFYNSLSRGYLETCIEHHPDHPYGRRCLAEYAWLILVVFSGYSGKHIPTEVSERLEMLRSLTKGHKIKPR